MYCKKCGYKLNESDSRCPFCNHPVNEEIETVVFSIKKANNVEAQKEVVKEEEPVVEDVRKQEYVNVSAPKMTYMKRNVLGYLNIKTNFIHHILIASIGYLAMYVVLILAARIMVSIYTSQGIDFSCLYDESLPACTPDVMEANLKISVISQIIAEFTIIGVVALIFIKYIKPLFSELKQGNTWKWIGIGFALMYGLTLVYSILLEVFKLTSTSTNQDAVNNIIVENPILGFLFVVVAAPLFEEIIFRLGVFRAFTNKNKKTEIIGLVVTTLLFAFVHMTATFEMTFADPSNPDWELFKSDMLSLPSYLIGAFSLTFAYYKSKNLITPMLMHMAWNFMAFISIMGTSVLDPSQSTSSIVNIFNLLTETLTRLF